MPNLEARGAMVFLLSTKNLRGGEVSRGISDIPPSVRVITRAVLGGVFGHPLRFFADIWKTTALGTSVHTSFPHNFRPKSLKVRSLGHVKWPRLTKSFNPRHSYTEWLIPLKLSVIDIRNSVYKIYISEFWYQWPKVRSILQPLYYLWVNERKLKGASFGQNH